MSEQSKLSLVVSHLVFEVNWSVEVRYLRVDGLADHFTFAGVDE